MREEKRRFKRVQNRIAVLLKERSGRKTLRGSLSKDLSEGGLRLLVEAFLPKDSLVDLQIEVDPKGSTRVPAVGRVRWQSSVPYTDNWYHLGIEFLEMDIASKNRIKDLVNKKLILGG